MIPIQGLFEARVSVRDSERSVVFYRDVVGLELGIAQPERPAVFFSVGGRGASFTLLTKLTFCSPRKLAL